VLASNSCTDTPYLLDTFAFLTALGLTPGGSSTLHIYTQTMQRIAQTIKLLLLLLLFISN
jgi:hypothetical protein